MVDPTGVTQPYDWDDYTSDWKPSPAYATQENLLLEVLTRTPESPKTTFRNVLEVGPGFGRITKLIMAKEHGFEPYIETYAALDVSAMALEQAQAFADIKFDTVIVSPIQNPDLAALGLSPLPASSLVLAIEVLLHIPPTEVFQAVCNLLDAASPDGWLVTCDWTEMLPALPSGLPRPIRNQNWRHDYASLFHAANAKEITSWQTGLQTIFVVRP